MSLVNKPSNIHFMQNYTIGLQKAKKFMSIKEKN
jgi:hypothetical protein